MRAAMPLALQLALLGAGAAASDADVQPAIDVITRNFGKEAAASFDLSIKAGPCSESVPSPCFAISENSGKVSIVATSMSELTYGIGHYTRFSCGLTVGWRNGGNSFTDAAAWPCHKGTLAAAAVPRAVKYTYQDNVCTHSYSYVWYDYEEWVAHIDVMALQGINVFLAITGQEEIQYKTFKQFGLTDTEIREFFNGPAYLTWSRGQSMQSVGTGPSFKFPGAGSGLPRSWMQSQHALQKQILALARPLGIIGVLPAFQGNTPPQLKKLFPTANVSTTQVKFTGLTQNLQVDPAV
jgi:alpha-N-acetylglucosaminidase